MISGMLTARPNTRRHNIMRRIESLRHCGDGDDVVEAHHRIGDGDDLDRVPQIVDRLDLAARAPIAFLFRARAA